MEKSIRKNIYICIYIIEVLYYKEEMNATL